MEKFGDEEPYLGENSYFPSRYPRATYAAMVSYLDEQVGELVEQLKEKGLYENTLIIFTSDNGPTFNGEQILLGLIVEEHSEKKKVLAKAFFMKAVLGFP